MYNCLILLLVQILLYSIYTRPDLRAPHSDLDESAQGKRPVGGSGGGGRRGSGGRQRRDEVGRGGVADGRTNDRKQRMRGDRRQEEERWREGQDGGTPGRLRGGGASGKGEHRHGAEPHEDRERGVERAKADEQRGCSQEEQAPEEAALQDGGRCVWCTAMQEDPAGHTDRTERQRARTRLNEEGAGQGVSLSRQHCTWVTAPEADLREGVERHDGGARCGKDGNGAHGGLRRTGQHDRRDVSGCDHDGPPSLDGVRGTQGAL